jgi:hypothetical protein
MIAARQEEDRQRTLLLPEATGVQPENQPRIGILENKRRRLYLMAKINKIIIGLIVLIAGIITMIVVPGWGKWLADYPAQVVAGAPAYIGSLPSTVQGSATGSLDALNYVLIPVINKAADWIKLAGYGGGALLALIGLFTTLGAMMKTEK